ncbi:MAG: glycine cleavage system aminomethyltransferase GcvT [Bacilli bacterium]
MKKTILFDEHINNHARMVEYAQFLMPVEYTGLVNEHLAVRNNCGLFDVSHMGEILIEGPDAFKFIDYIMTGKLSKEDMRMSYGLMLYPNGTVVDDLMTYRFSENNMMLVVNASNKDKDLEWLLAHKEGFDINIIDLSDSIGLLALQGPNAHMELSKLTNYDLSEMQMFDIRKVKINNSDFIISRSGYTGEDGFEIYGSNNDILKLFKEFVANEVTLCGLGCRDTLRFEANMPLYGHEISDSINPLEATLKFAIDFDKNFIGRDALNEVVATGLQRKIVALELLEKGIARSDYEVYRDNKKIGYITTGYMIPGTSNVFALAMLDKGNWDLQTEVDVKVRNKFVKAKVRNKKFLNKRYVK